MADQLPSEYREYFSNVFNEFDQNGDGLMSKQELKGLMVALGQNMDEKMVDELVEQIDQDQNGIVDLDQFLHLVKILLKQSDPGQQFPKVFKVFDRDGNGSISLGELSEVMESYGEGFTQSQLVQIMAWTQEQECQGLDLQQFTKLLMKQDSF